MLRRTTLRLGSRLYSLDTPLVMGIINVTPDSFYAGSRVGGEEALHARIQQLIAEDAGNARGEIGAAVCAEQFAVVVEADGDAVVA